MNHDPVRRAAAELDRRGLAVPGRLLADAHRPLAPLLTDLAAALGPLARAVAGPRGAAMTTWLEEPDALDALVAALDDREEQRAGPG
jgi:hypothetical protein